MDRGVRAEDIPDSAAIMFGVGGFITALSAVASLAGFGCELGVVIGLVLMAEGLRAADSN